MPLNCTRVGILEAQMLHRTVTNKTLFLISTSEKLSLESSLSKSSIPGEFT